MANKSSHLVRISSKKSRRLDKFKSIYKKKTNALNNANSLTKIGEEKHAPVPEAIPISTYKKLSHYVELECKYCRTLVVNLSSKTTNVVCGRCVAIMAGPPEAIVKSKQTSSGHNRPRGWHFKKRFVDTDGTVYSFGELVNEPKTKLPKRGIQQNKIKSANSDKKRISTSSKRSQKDHISKPAPKKTRTRKKKNKHTNNIR